MGNCTKHSDALETLTGVMELTFTNVEKTSRRVCGRVLSFFLFISLRNTRKQVSLFLSSCPEINTVNVEVPTKTISFFLLST